MKKLIGITLLVLFAVFPSFSNNLELLGNITPFLQLTLSENEIDLFDFDDSGFDETQTATGSVTVTERSNRFAGYTVTVASAGEWNLVSEHYDSEAPDPAFLLGYTFTYAGAAPPDYNSSSILITDSNSRTPGSGIDKVFAVSVDIPVGAPEGEYSDTLTFTIAAK